MPVGEIEAVLRETGVKGIAFPRPPFPDGILRRLRRPLFPMREGELVHAEMPEQPATGSQILH